VPQQVFAALDLFGRSGAIVGPVRLQCFGLLGLAVVFERKVAPRINCLCCEYVATIDRLRFGSAQAFSSTWLQGEPPVPYNSPKTPMAKRRADPRKTGKTIDFSRKGASQDTKKTEHMS
jgi:hypothetical protein